MNLYYDVKRLDLRLVNLNLAITSTIGPQVEEDIYKYSLKSGSAIRGFILYRVLLFIIENIKLAAQLKLKLIFYINPTLDIENLQMYSSYFNVCIRKLAKILTLSLFVDSANINDVVALITDLSGEGREVRARISMISDKTAKRPDLNKLDKLLIKSGITKVYTDILDSYKAKIGLYTT